eukprot:14050762-Alexandrium_andersonii.AAC.1
MSPPMRPQRRRSLSRLPGRARPRQTCSQKPSREIQRRRLAITGVEWAAQAPPEKARWPPATRSASPNS